MALGAGLSFITPERTGTPNLGKLLAKKLKQSKQGNYSAYFEGPKP